jgi:hypothetical protein
MTQEELKLVLDALENGDVPTSENAGKNLDAITAIKQALAQTQEPVAWVDPTTLHHLKIGLEGVHLVYETEMVNSLPLYEKPHKTENVGCLGMPVNVPVTPPQRTWVGLTAEDMKGMSYGDKVVAAWADRTLRGKNT